MDRGEACDIGEEVSRGIRYRYAFIYRQRKLFQLSSIFVYFNYNLKFQISIPRF